MSSAFEISNDRPSPSMMDLVIEAIKSLKPGKTKMTDIERFINQRHKIEVVRSTLKSVLDNGVSTGRLVKSETSYILPVHGILKT